jgi:hypothetical protein
MRSSFRWVPPLLLLLALPAAGQAQFDYTTNNGAIGCASTVVVVEACTDLAHPIWSPLQTNTLAGSSSYFSDPQWTNYPARLYRLRSP